MLSLERVRRAIESSTKVGRIRLLVWIEAYLFMLGIAWDAGAAGLDGLFDC
jgi:hypothetical protein